MCVGNSPARKTSGLFRKNATRSTESSCGWERDSPETSCSNVLLRKFDAIGMDALRGTHLCDNSRGNLRAAFISHHDGRADHQFTTDRDGGAMLVQVRGFGGD